MRKICLALSVFTVLVFSLVVLVKSQTPSTPTTPTATVRSVNANIFMAFPEHVGLPSDRLERTSNVIQRSIAAGLIAGATAKAARPGKIAYFKALGMADRDGKK